MPSMAYDTISYSFATAPALTNSLAFSGETLQVWNMSMVPARRSSASTPPTVWSCAGTVSTLMSSLYAGYFWSATASGKRR